MGSFCSHSPGTRISLFSYSSELSFNGGRLAAFSCLPLCIWAACAWNEKLSWRALVQLHQEPPVSEMKGFLQQLHTMHSLCWQGNRKESFHGMLRTRSVVRWCQEEYVSWVHWCWLQPSGCCSLTVTVFLPHELSLYLCVSAPWIFLVTSHWGLGSAKSLSYASLAEAFFRIKNNYNKSSDLILLHCCLQRCFVCLVLFSLLFAPAFLPDSVGQWSSYRDSKKRQNQNNRDLC